VTSSEPTLADLAKAYANAKSDLETAKAALRQRVVIEHAGGHGKSESQIAREAGVDRMTIRKWLGK
jgi:hypothetical protein